ncbi:hypothetical protein KSP39_PZI009259 [Platanthera zijinensis]|uniref:Uncharacterized protein n=1 Tax=Platanthera zijinensis TaxID=2320716 RepID=A0AAP0BMS2_9ASPA
MSLPLSLSSRFLSIPRLSLSSPFLSIPRLSLSISPANPRYAITGRQSTSTGGGPAISRTNLISPSVSINALISGDRSNIPLFLSLSKKRGEDCNNLRYMRKLCANLEREDALDTVLEVPLPEEMFPSEKVAGGGGEAKAASSSSGQNPHYAWLKSQAFDKEIDGGPPQLSGKSAELQLLLSVVGSPLIPTPVPIDAAFNRSVREPSIRASTAKYILQQYIAATGGQAALTSVQSMCAVGKVRMSASEFHTINDSSAAVSPSAATKSGAGVIGGFVLWQKTPELWFFDLIMAGCKMSAGCNGRLAWRQSTSDHSHASRGPPRPLRRSLQGLDPRSTANLFVDAVFLGEKKINDDDCFVLKLEVDAQVLRSRSGSSFDIIRHTVWGYFSQRTGLLMQLDDSHLLRMRSGRGRPCAAQLSSCATSIDPNNGANNDASIFWETTMETIIEDYRRIDGINIAHRGRTVVTLFRHGEDSVNHKRQMVELWTIEEADFNFHGLAMDYFLPPSDLKIESD